MARTVTKTQFCRAVATSLQDFGYPTCTHVMVRECLDAWLAGKRGLEMPHGVIGAFASRQFDDAEEMAPGALKSMEN